MKNIRVIVFGENENTEYLVVDKDTDDPLFNIRFFQGVDVEVLQEIVARIVKERQYVNSKSDN